MDRSRLLADSPVPTREASGRAYAGAVRRFDGTPGEISPTAWLVVDEKRYRTWMVRELQDEKAFTLMERAQSHGRALPEMVSNAINPPGEPP
jgi:hypothetical protein